MMVLPTGSEQIFDGSLASDPEIGLGTIRMYHEQTSFDLLRNLFAEEMVAENDSIQFHSLQAGR